MLDEQELTRKQLRAAVAAIRYAFEPGTILAVWLYGSAVSGGLRHDSDLDLLGISARSVEPAEKRRLVHSLMQISRRGSRPAGWRPLELTVVNQVDVRPWRYPPPCQLQYGEWLTDDELAAQISARPTANPDLAVILAMVRLNARVVVGPPPEDLIDPVPRADLVRAMVDALPALLGDLESDTRNVLLTLARIWLTVGTGQIRSKDAAADWALRRLAPVHRPLLAHARDLYIEGGYGEWGRDMERVRDLADEMVAAIDRLRAAELGGRATPGRPKVRP